MAISTNIGLEKLTANQTSPEATVNTALEKIDNSLNAVHTEAFSDADIPLTDIEFLENSRFVLTGTVTQLRDLVIPQDYTIGSDTIDPVNKYFWVECGVTGASPSVQVVTEDSAGTGISLNDGDCVLCYADGLDVIAVCVMPRVLVDDHTYPGIPVRMMVDVPDAATGNIDIVIDKAMRVVDVKVVKTGGAGGASDTIQVLESTNAISDALDINVADQVIVRASTIDDANWDIAAAGTLRITRTKVSAANVACKVFVEGVLI